MSKCINGFHMGNIYISERLSAWRRSRALNRPQRRKTNKGPAAAGAEARYRGLMHRINYFGTSKISLRLIQTKANAKLELAAPTPTPTPTPTPMPTSTSTCCWTQRFAAPNANRVGIIETQGN